MSKQTRTIFSYGMIEHVLHTARYRVFCTLTEGRQVRIFSCAKRYIKYFKKIALLQFAAYKHTG